MVPKNKDKSSSPPSDGSNEDDEESQQDLNQILIETQRKINEEHRRLAQIALDDAKANVADIRGRSLHEMENSHKEELNHIYQTLLTSLNEENKSLIDLMKKYDQYDLDIQNAVEELFKGWQKQNEESNVIGNESEKIIDEAMKDEMEAIEEFKIAMGMKEKNMSRKSDEAMNE
ncbi:uncharacterized protein IL334_001584 [Kwoniella shivajii]|uniref:Uncharacterized protein n=1 Tax=Kwoniella shivajii TaxID=564305 RepID=A0ABZ1CSP4_9TREE|nr:hypothetical protein IL334_001584 [Kwoniella shivajii]